MPSEPLQGSLAAVDLGSNSFHMIIARVLDPEVDMKLQVVDRIREPVRLAAGLGPDGRLDAASTNRALRCLERFAERIGPIPDEHVRAVGTNTLRQASRTPGLLESFEQTLGHRIDVLPGREEARLIYAGVARSIADDAQRRLVVDIGGGSTECIIGTHLQPRLVDSLYMGCVSFSQRYFADGAITAAAFEAARTAAALEVEPIAERYRQLGWASCVGASGTVSAVAQVLRGAGWGDGGITPSGLKKLRKAMVAAGSAAKVELPGLPDDRRSVLPGGVAILAALVEELGIDAMVVASGALREGLLYDLLGRMADHDLRDEAVQGLCERYSVDRRQAVRVERMALHLLGQVAGPWDVDARRARHLLRWAAQLHEIGLALAHSGYHKHGAYLVANSDLPGFSRGEQDLLAAIVRSHRRKLTKTAWRAVPRSQQHLAQRLSVLLRLAVLLARSRPPQPVPLPAVDADAKGLRLRFVAGWLDAHPLTRADLEQEGAVLHGVGIKLRAR